MDVPQQNDNILIREPISRNDATSVRGVRKCWATARERNRMKARYAIQQRVFCANSHDVSSSLVCGNALDHFDARKNILHRIIRGDTSYFSLHFEILNDPFPSDFLWETHPNGVTLEATDSKAPILLDIVRLRSRLGPQNLSELECYASDIDTCTILEYAVWLQRYRIVRQLIIGGIDPIRSRSVMLSNEQSVRAKEVGLRIRQLFLSGAIPLTLSCYVASRVIGLRQSTWSDRQSTHIESLSESVRSAVCMICGATTDLLTYSSSVKRNEDDCLSCHRFCEICIWDDILKHLDSRDGDVVKCPICHCCKNSSNVSEIISEMEQVMPLDSELNSESNEACLELYTTSLANYNALPIDSAMIQQIASKKRIPPEREIICSTWSDAVKPFIGATQTSRREKFFHFVEKGSFHHVKACINQGIDLNIRNEYGQTAFFIAVWQHNVPLVRLLLQYGCDRYIVANGGISPYSVAKLHGYATILEIFEQDESMEDVDETSMKLFYKSSTMVQQLPSPSVTTLIDLSLDHPGAGSFIVDDFLEDFFTDALFDLWNVLPVELVSKKKIKIVPCSERRYYCDAYRVISKTICDVLMKEITDERLPFKQILCGPFMRFLNYSESGAVLSPHIDLSRTDPTSTQRSTHSFLLYLSTCRHGGETALLGAVTGDGRDKYLATIAPKKGRVLIFPHRCPHEGLVVVDTPKMLIRGELWIS